MKTTRWLLTYFLIVGVVLGGLAGFNYFIDPLWNFSHASTYNDVQKPINERQQKTNRITFDDHQYDTLILGSSRMTYVNQNDFKGYNAYNYAMALAFTSQFEEMIAYAEKANGKAFDTIVLGLDYFSSNVKMKPQLTPIKPAIDKVNEPFYRYKTLLSLDTFRHAREDFQHSRDDILFPARSYDRNNVAVAPIKDPEKVKASLQQWSDRISFEYDPSFKEMLVELKQNNPNTTFIPLTTPVTAIRLTRQLAEESKLSGYQQWMRDCVDVFGSVYNFMDINSITTDTSNYFDSNHFYPRIGTLIAHRVIGYANPDIPSDFGTVVTKENVDEHLRAVEARVDRFREAG